MNVEYDNFVIARPGHNAKYNRDVGWDELRRTFLLYKRIPMIVAGGDHFGPIDPNHAVGFVDAKLDEDAQIVRGEPVFFKERFEQVPVEIQQLLMHKQHVPASLGYEEFDNMRKVDHIAIGVKSPVFKDVGFNAESRFRYEETDGMNKQSSPPAKEEAKPVQFVTKEDFEKFSAKVFELLQHSQRSPPPEPVKAQAVEQEAKKETEAPPKEALPTPQPTPIAVEPERVIPKGKSTPITNDGWLVDEYGRRYLSYPVAGREATRKGETT